MNLDWLHRNRVAYKCYPYTDTPSETHHWGWYYENGTTERYKLFYSDNKISSYRSLYWHLSVIYWVNSSAVRKLEPIKKYSFLSVCLFLSSKENGFVSFDIKEESVEKIYKTIIKLNQKPTNKSVKFVFRDGAGLSFKDKMSIIGSYSNSSKISDEAIIEAIKKNKESGDRVTNKSLSLIIGCSERTIQRHMTDDLKKLKKTMNNEVV